MTSAHTELEKSLQDSNATPMSLPLEFLRAITCDFSSELELGRGGYGVVYKGVLPSGKIIAVKKLYGIHLLEDNKFQDEAESLMLMGIKHQNIVQFLGYCAESRFEVIQLPTGEHIWPEIPRRLLCFEYVCNKSLDKYISDESSGLEWNLRFEIIKGICSGLNFLHEECRIVHLDLKPENILMHTAMVPKIADFGLSKIFGDGQSRIITDNRAGSRGYMAPKYLIQGIVSTKADIFSLGVIIIEIITGFRDFPFVTAYFQLFSENDGPQSNGTSFQHFTQRVLESWRNKFTSTLEYKLTEKYTQQVSGCISIALKCVDPGTEKRPSAKDIIQMLNALDQLTKSCRTSVIQCKEKLLMLNTTISKELTTQSVTNDMFNDVTWGKVLDEVKSGEGLLPMPLSESDTGNQNCQNAVKVSTSPQLANDITPDSSEFLVVNPLELRFPFEPNKLTPCSLHLTNNTDEYAAFVLMDKSNDRMCFVSLPLCGFVPPRSTYTLIVTTDENENLPEEIEADLILQTSRCDEYTEPFEDIYDCRQYFEKVKELGNTVHKVALKAVYALQGDTPCEETPPLIKIISMEKTHAGLYSLDANWSEPWIITGHADGCVSLWDYDTQEPMGLVKVSKSAVHCVRFIARKQWFLAGSYDGFIHVGNCKTEMQNITRFRAHRNFVESMAVHPTRPYVLSSSYEQIKVWDWDQGWTCIQSFQGHSDVINQVAFNPEDTNSFASASSDHKVKVWSLDPPNTMYTLSGHRDKVNSLYFFTRDNQQYLITGSNDKTANIWNLKKKGCVRTMKAMSPVVSVVCHSNLPVLITGTGDGLVYLWSSTNFRLKRILNICFGGDVYGLACLMMPRRLMIGNILGVSMLEIHDKEPVAMNGNDDNSIRATH